MALLCAIVPEYVLEGIIEKGLAPQDTIHRCQSTLEKTKQLQDVRERHRHSIAAAQPQQTTQGIVPPYILEALARNAATEQQREAAGHTLAYSTKHRTVAGRVRQLNRTVYDAQNSRALHPPRDKIRISEGGDLLSQETDPTNNANECYVGLGKTYDFYFNFFQRDSFDNNGIKLDGFVHAGDLYNAFYNGEELVFGDGDGVIFDGFTDELDVIGHEFSHGVVDFTSRLPYVFQSGALNESLADAFGIMVKQWGEGSPQTVDQANWLIGEGIWGPSVKGRALRDMANPGTAYDDGQVGKDPQPAHWRDFKKLTLSDDSGGVHINSGIPNRAFFLAATKIGGFAWEGVGPIWYRALSSGKLPTNGKATFKEFADLTIENAGEHVDKVREAWTAVGYPFPEKRHEL
ncbi:Peptidase M4 [Penicillium griseofulvum]|uniref:Peptidase M4 n=1 Tax=Penicillium patulum TaxID=5078 RepID=A0A135LP80_PENPA|nr:Peptidase M4 [Penicillium griseofulvum]KXG50762.1 Peptidase M4 [Penicillium griseofulvum]